MVMTLEPCGMVLGVVVGGCWVTVVVIVDGGGNGDMATLAIGP